MSGEDGAPENLEFAVALADRDPVDASFDSSRHGVHADLHILRVVVCPVQDPGTKIKARCKIEEHRCTMTKIQYCMSQLSNAFYAGAKAVC